MPNDYYQCCYTNAELNVGGVVSSGWQAVAVSPGLPSTVMNTCTSIQNVNSSIQRAMMDEMGQVLDLFEVYGDSGYVYALHSKYGMVDRLGRPNMFSHAIIFDWNTSGALKDPNVFLSLDASNFKDNLQDAEAMGPSLAYLDSLDIDTALNAVGMSPESYLTLIRCVYTKMTERGINQPLFVAYDGSVEMLRTILYCIYYGLPYFLRKRLSIASSPSSNGAANKDLVFSIHARNKQLWVDPTNGENNVLNPRVERKISRYGFADYAIAHLDTVDEEAYFEELERTVEELGDPTASDLLLLKIAHTILVDPDVASLSDAVLEGRISDALRSRPLGCERMDSYIASLLNVAIEREMVLTEESEADLAAKVAETQSIELRTSDENYAIYLFSALPVEDAARRLARLDANTLARYTSRLRMTDRGVAILDNYYAHFALAPSDLGWDALNHVRDYVEDEELLSYPLTRKRVYEYANTLYLASFKEPKKVVDCYKAYVALVGRLVPDDQVAEFANAAKQRYWQSVSYATFDFEAKDTYFAMKDGGVRANTSCRLAAMGHDELWGVGDAEGLTEADALEEVYAFFQEDYREGFENGRERSEAIETLCDYVTDGYEGSDSQFGQWMRVAIEAPSREVLDAIIRTRAALNEDDFDGVIQGYTDLSKLARGKSTDSVRQVNKTVAELVCTHCVEREQTDLDYLVPLDVWLVMGNGIYPSNVFRVFDDYDAVVLHLDEYDALEDSCRFGMYPYSEMAADYARTGKAGRVVNSWIKAMKRKQRMGRIGFGNLFGRGKDERRDTASPTYMDEELAEDFDEEPEIAEPKKKGFFPFGRGGR